MKAGFEVFDSDMHCIEPPDLWERHIDSRFRDRAPRSSDFAFRNATVSVEADETFVTHVVDEMGADNIVFSTDWPHPDSRYPKSVDSFLEIPMPDSARRRILWENCAWLYGLEGARP